MLTVEKHKRSLDQIMEQAPALTRSPIATTNTKRVRSSFVSDHHSPPPSLSTDVPTPVDKYIPVRKRRRDTTGQVLPTNPNEKVFSLQDVRHILTRALSKKEEELKKEFGAILESKLKEQYNTFARYHEDHISQKLRHSQHSYFI